MNKFFLIDKPLHISSFDIIRKMRKKFHMRKMGHTGTLDPLATGGVLVATGQYTKLIPYFEKDTKVYEFTVSLDGQTESYDLGTPVKYLQKEQLEKFQKEITRDLIQDTLKKCFTGEISQLPPKYSALKIGGKKAVDLVRNGEDVNLKTRKVTIFSIEVLDFSFPQVILRAKVSSGTYIRSIASDLGNILGTGGYVAQLRRIVIGNLESSLFQNLDTLTEDNCIPESLLFGKEEFISLDKQTQKDIDNGLPVYKKFDHPIGVNLFVSQGNDITNIVIYDGEKLIPKRKIQ